MKEEYYGNQKDQPEELDVLLKMYENARRFMATHGNASQWGNTYPSPQLILDDITEGNSYVCTEQDQIIATFYYKEGADPTYMRIYDGDWINDSRYGVVHRITSIGNVKGAASFCLNWALEQCGNIRIDTHRDNIVMQHLLDKNGSSIAESYMLKMEQNELLIRKWFNNTKIHKARSRDI